VRTEIWRLINPPVTSANVVVTFLGAIGGATAAMAGADILCYLTPAEHLGLPDPEDVYAGDRLGGTECR